MIDFAVLSEDFSDLPNLTEMLRITIKLLIAAALGGLLGYERQLKGKAAGLRTHMVVAMGSALFIISSQQAGTNVADLSRVIQGVVTGIGFLGAGAILKHSEQTQVSGLTTASCIWLATAVGISVGLGRIFTAVIATGISLLILVMVKSPNAGVGAEEAQGTEPG